MEQIRYTLEVEGSMYEANYFELTERQYQDLKAKGERSKTWKKIEDWTSPGLLDRFQLPNCSSSKAIGLS